MENIRQLVLCPLMVQRVVFFFGKHAQPLRSIIYIAIGSLFRVLFIAVINRIPSAYKCAVVTATSYNLNIIFLKFLYLFKQKNTFINSFRL